MRSVAVIGNDSQKTSRHGHKGGERGKLPAFVSRPLASATRTNPRVIACLHHSRCYLLL